MTTITSYPLRRRAAWLCAWIAASAISFALFARPSTARLDEDELYWIGSAYYFHLAFQRGAVSHPDWELLPARENPPVAKYVLGLGLAASGQSVSSLDLLGTFYLLFEKMPGAWGTGDDYAKRNDVVARMQPEFRERVRAGARLQLDQTLLRNARITMIVCAVLASLTVFLLGSALVNPLAGLVASQLFNLHPAVVYAYNHALSDIVALLFSVIAALAVFGLIRQIHTEPVAAFRIRLVTALVAGALLALACGAKMNSLVVAIHAGTAGLAAMIAAWRRDPIRGRQVFLCGTVLFATAFCVFIAINPSVFGELGPGLVATVREHRLTEAIQARFLPDHLSALTDKISAVGQLTCFSLAALIALVLAAAGSLLPQHSGLRFIGLWCLISLICVLLWIPFPRGRYVLPVILPGVILIGCVLSEGLSAIQRKLQISKQVEARDAT